METAAKLVGVDCETSALWVDMLAVVVVALGAQSNVVDALVVELAVGEADLEETAATTSDSSM